MILISISLIYTVFKNIHFKRILEFKFNRILEIDAFVSDEKGNCCIGKGESEKENNKHEKDKEKNREIFLIFTFVNFLANFLIVFLIANIQIINRVSTSNPFLYVYCSEFIMEFKKQKNPFGKFILIIFISYSVVGCIMHCASYGYA